MIEGQISSSQLGSEAAKPELRPEIEIIRYEHRDIDDPEVLIKWTTSPGLGDVVQNVGTYIDRTEKAVLGEYFVVNSVWAFVGENALLADAEKNLNHLPGIDDFEKLCQDAYKKGISEIGMFGCVWPGSGAAPRGELWCVNQRMTIRSYVAPQDLCESGINALSEFFKVTALQPEFTQEFVEKFKAIIPNKIEK